MTRVTAVEGYALWAETWETTPSPVVGLEQRMLLPWLERIPARRVVDVGCGTGRWTAPLGAVGIDLSPAMLAVASRKPLLRGRLAVADAAALPIASASAALALCTLTLGHLLRQVSAWKELSRILQPGGTLLLTDFHPAAAAQGWRRTFRHAGRVYELENYPYTLEDLCEAAPELVLQERVDAAFGEPQRAIFEEAGRPELFDAARTIPAVLLTRWSRR